MRQRLLLLALIPLLSACGFVNFPQGGNSGGSSAPSGGSGSRDGGTRIDRVSLTDRYTVIELTFVNRNQPRYDQTGRQIYSGVEYIQIGTNTTLYALNGSRTFPLVRADGIPRQPSRINTRPGDQVSFTLYFDRLDPGIERFDFFECNDSDQIVCWNFYDVPIDNPAPYRAPTSKRPVPTDSGPVPGAETPTTPIPAPPAAPTEVVVRGTVLDAKTKKPVSATINFLYSLNKKLIDSVQSFPQTGQYRIRLQPGFVYQLSSTARGYLVSTDVLDLSKTSTAQAVQKDVLLTPIKVGDRITLKNIYFEATKSVLLDASFAELDKLVALMGDHPTMEIRLEGHTDVIGDHKANQKLSEDRVGAVKAYLISQRIDASRISAVGYGDTRPLVAKGSDAERKVNRRVEFVVVKM